MKKARIQPFDETLLWLFLAVCLVLLLIMPTLLQWEHDGQDFGKWMFYTLVSLCTATVFLCFLRSFEWAIFTQDGILVKCIFGTVKFLEYAEIISITKGRKQSYRCRTYIHRNWFIIKEQQIVECPNKHSREMGFNRKKNAYIGIVANEKNTAIVNELNKRLFS